MHWHAWLCMTCSVHRFGYSSTSPWHLHKQMLSSSQLHIICFGLSFRAMCSYCLPHTSLCAAVVLVSLRLLHWYGGR